MHTYRVASVSHLCNSGATGFAVADPVAPFPIQSLSLTLQMPCSIGIGLHLEAEVPAHLQHHGVFLQDVACDDLRVLRTSHIR